MMRVIVSFLITLIPAISSSQHVVDSDICIYGNSSASVTAAIQAAKQGNSVVIVSPDRYIGGMSVQGLGGLYINNHREFKNDGAVGGLTLEFYTGLGIAGIALLKKRE